jgi:hypothetical protein
MESRKSTSRLGWASVALLFAVCVTGSVHADQAADLVALANKIQNQAPGINFTIGTEKFAYNVSESLYFTFTADQDCYVAIVDIGTSGKMTLLFPNQWHPSNRIEKGKEYRIPPEGSNFAYTLTGPPGTEHIKVVASVNQVLSQVQSLQQEAKVPVGRSGDRFLTMKNPGLVLKDIQVAFSGIDPSKWATGGLSFEVVEPSTGSSSSQDAGAPLASGQSSGQ